MPRNFVNRRLSAARSSEIVPINLVLFSVKTFRLIKTCVNSLNKIMVTMRKRTPSENNFTNVTKKSSFILFGITS